MINWLVFIPACFLLNCAPGPNNMLAFTRAARHGFRSAVVSGTGRLPAFAFMIVLTIIGLGAVLQESAIWFSIIKLVGAAYLVYVGIRMFLTARKVVLAQSGDDGLVSAIRRDFTIAITNPKAIAIFTAFFPQFLNPAANIPGQLVQLGGVFLVLEVAAVVVYALGGVVFKGLLKGPGPFIALQRLVGAALTVSGVSMAVSERG